MKYSKRYICLTIILLLVVALKFNRNGSEQVETFRGAQMEPKVWNPLIAESVNENPLSLVVDNRIYSNEDYDIYMNRKLDIMIPVSLVRDSFNCSAGLYDKEKLVVEKHEESADFSLEDKQLTKKNDNYYVSASKLSKSLSYDYSWDIQKNTASAADISGATSIYPSKYDLREKGRATTVKNQGSLGTCWASASVSALETALLPEESVQFSVDHMTLKNSFAQAQNDGGEYTMGMAYLTAWQGPVYEADDPYGDGESLDGLKPVKHVQEIQVIEGKDFEKIKNASHLGLAHMDQILPTLLLFRKIGALTKCNDLYLSAIDLCDSMVADYAERREKIRPTHDFSKDIIESAKNIAIRYQCDMAHIENVVYLATEIFDNIRKLHGLGKRERLLLQIAVILHSCGAFVNMAQTRENSYKIIMSTEIIGISHIERVMAANIVRYNNEYFPDYQDIDEEEITKDQYITIVKLCAILKLANVLDKSNHQRIQKVRMSLKENSLQITAYTLQDITLEKGLFHRKADVFEEVFGIRPVLKKKEGTLK